MNSKDIRGLPVISIADGTQVGTIDQVYLDLAAKQVVGFSITHGLGPFGGARDNAPTVAASGVHSLGPDALMLDDVTAVHAADVGAVATVEFDARTFAITAVEISPGLFQTKTHIPLDQLVRIGQDVLVVAEVAAAASKLSTAAE